MAKKRLIVSYFQKSPMILGAWKNAYLKETSDILKGFCIWIIKLMYEMTPLKYYI